MKRNIIALIYDFDKTLTDKDMQDYGFIPSLGMTPEDFWRDCNNMAHEKKMDGILAMMYFMIERARGKSVLTADTLKELGKDVNYYPGVTEWFDAVNEYGKSKGVVIEHYIISSGLKKIIEGTEIAKNFCEIFASEFVYDEYGVPYWPAVALNYTSKIQFLYRINKGIFDVSDDKNLNDSMEERNRRIPFCNMIYIGDGLTDVPSMKVTRLNGGHSIGVYADEQENACKMMKAGRINFMAKADYTKDSELMRIVKRIVDMLAAENDLMELSLSQYDNGFLKFDKTRNKPNGSGINAMIFLKKEELCENYASFSIIFDVYLLLYIKKV